MASTFHSTSVGGALGGLFEVHLVLDLQPPQLLFE